MKSPPLPGGLPSAGLFRAVLVALVTAVGAGIFLLWWEVPTGVAVPSAPRPPTLEEVAPAGEEELAVPPRPTPTATLPSAPGRYTVKEGDTLLAIAIRYGTTVEALAKANNLKEPYPLRVGQELAIPGTAEAAPATPTATPSLQPSPTPTPAPPSGPRVHTVKEGDTLLAIAIRYGTTVEALAKANDLDEPYPLKIGQELVIPPG